MSTPPWADETLSRELPILRSQGEGQKLEYMAQFPQQVRELGKEIAAFATSGGGRILIGVDNAGDLAALTGTGTPFERDTLIKRVEGISHGTVKPAITPTIAFASEGANTVLVIDVPAGDQPVYYSGGVPYVRHLTQSRPAEPHEIIELVEAWLEGPGKEPDDGFFRRVAQAVSPLLAFASDFEVWEDGEPYGSLLSVFSLATSTLRFEARSDFAVERGFSSRLAQLADAAERVLHSERTLSLESRQELKALVAAVQAGAQAAAEEILAVAPPNRGRAAQSRRYLREDVREVVDLAARLPQLARSGRILDARNDASRIGERLALLGLFPLREQDEALADTVRAAGLKLLRLEAIIPTEWDGGQGREEIVSVISNAATELRGLLEVVRD